MNPSEGMFVDHINRKQLDNRRENLRLCSKADNLRNSGKQKNNKSGYIGVSYHKKAKKWQVTIGYKGKYNYLGIFNNRKEAAKVYNDKAKELLGKFAVLNKL
jgi:hypothetical protein